MKDIVPNVDRLRWRVLDYPAEEPKYPQLGFIETKDRVNMGLYWDITVRDANKLLLGLILFEICLVVIFVADTLLGSPSWNIKHLFDLDGENNIPAWFSAVQLLLIGLAFLLKSRQPDPDYSPSPSFFLTGGIGFIYLSADEAASIHEAINGMLKSVKWLPRLKGDQGIWFFIYGLIGLILLLANFRGIVAMCNRYRHSTTIMALGMGIVLLGSVGLEAISYQYLRSGSTPLLYSMEVALEEFLEMTGVSVTLYGAILLLLHEPKVKA